MSSRIPQWNKIHEHSLHHLFPSCDDIFNVQSMYLCYLCYQNLNSVLKGSNNETFMECDYEWMNVND